ncbi:MAG: tetratricopeptide repeat protein [Planctomycetales bacterium]|nr:tetratricopeptide repeat protein [Planctomycetales bacterium]
MRDLSTVAVKDLFAESELKVEDLLELRRQVFRRTARKKELERAIEEIRKGTEEKPKFASADDQVRYGASLWILGRTREAIEILEELKNLPTSGYFLARAHLDLGHVAEAAAIAEKLAAKQKGSLDVRLVWVEAIERTGDLAAAQAVVEAMVGDFPESADALAHRGVIREMEADHEAASEAFESALARDPQCATALFRYAYLLDSRGDDEQAIELYQRCARLRPPPANALLNLGILYEDRNQFERAIECYRSVLRTYPNHMRAQLYLKDAVASLDMVVDEEQERSDDRRAAVLKTPITDFELSVRSRNCLSKMGISTLGDLVKRTEEDLMSYKNFGDTSLAEIKAILESKGLRLGLAKEEEEQRRLRESLLQVTPEDEKEALYQRPVIELDLSLRVRKAMQLLNVNTVGDLIQKSPQDLLAQKNFGETSLKEVRQKLAVLGLSLKDDKQTA